MDNDKARVVEERRSGYPDGSLEEEGFRLYLSFQLHGREHVIFRTVTFTHV